MLFRRHYITARSSSLLSISGFAFCSEISARKISCKTNLQRLLNQMLVEAQLSIEEPRKVARQWRIDLGARNGAVLDFGGATSP